MPVDLSVAVLDLPDINNMPIRQEQIIQGSIEEGEEESQMVGSMTRIFRKIHIYLQLTK